jgi:hypothetical protein
MRAHVSTIEISLILPERMYACSSVVGQGAARALSSVRMSMLNCSSHYCLHDVQSILCFHFDAVHVSTDRFEFLNVGFPRFDDFVVGASSARFEIATNL